MSGDFNAHKWGERVEKSQVWLPEGVKFALGQVIVGDHWLGGGQIKS